MTESRFIFTHFDHTNQPIDLRSKKEIIPDIRNSYFCGFRVQAPYGHHYYHTIVLTDATYQLRIASEQMAERLLDIYPELNQDNIRLVYTRSLMPWKSMESDTDISKLIDDEFEPALDELGADFYFVIGQSGKKVGIVIVEASGGLAAMELAINISNKVHDKEEYNLIGAFQLHEVSREFNNLFIQHCQLSKLPAEYEMRSAMLLH